MVTSTIALALETMIDRRLKRPNQWRGRQQLARYRVVTTAFRLVFVSWNTPPAVSCIAT
jgi:hypothetical protein